MPLYRYDLHARLPTGERNFGVFRPDAVRALARKGAQHLKAGEAMAMLGVSTYVFWLLRRSNFMPEMPREQRIRPGDAYELKTVQALLKKLERMVKPRPADDLVGILDFPRFHMSVASGCVAVAKGEISPCAIDVGETGLRRLRFSPGRKLTETPCTFFAALISKTQTERRLVRSEISVGRAGR